MNSINLIWNILNTCLIGLLAIWINISLYIPKQLEAKVDKMEVELNTHMLAPDSIFIQVDNHINIPKSIKIVK